MTRVNWAELEVVYIVGGKLSYQDLANTYGVAKSTVVRHAKKHSWKDKRQQFNDERIAEVLRRTNQDRIQVEERHLRILKANQALVGREIKTMILKHMKTGSLSTEDWTTINMIYNIFSKAMMTERAIIGLSSKPVRITNPEYMEQYQIDMGYIAEPYDKTAKRIEDTMKSLKSVENRIKRMNKLRNRG
ncbi:MAG: hypothetical protein WAO28_04590 [Candidatus Microsaccharimonas sp.]